jgi:hypothetical protein
MSKGLKAVVALNIVSALLIAWIAVMLGGGFTGSTPFPPGGPIELQLQSIERAQPSPAAWPTVARPAALPHDPRDSAPRWSVDDAGRVRSHELLNELPPWQRPAGEPQNLAR